VTGADGRFSFAGIAHGASYQLIPSKSGFTFSPATASGTVYGDVTRNFAAYQLSSSASSSSPTSSSSVSSSSSSSSVSSSSSSSASSLYSVSSSSDDRVITGCVSVDLIADKIQLALGPSDLELSARRALAKLRRAAKTTSPSLAKRLKRSLARAQKKIAKLAEEARVSLQQAPDQILICETDPPCYYIDNSHPINQHKNAIRRLRGTTTRTLNRGTRLVSKSVTEARRFESEAWS
jgi:hypothetical protein